MTVIGILSVGDIKFFLSGEFFSFFKEVFFFDLLNGTNFFVMVVCMLVMEFVFMGLLMEEFIFWFFFFIVKF